MYYIVSYCKNLVAFCCCECWHTSGSNPLLYDLSSRCLASISPYRNMTLGPQDARALDPCSLHKCKYLQMETTILKSYLIMLHALQQRQLTVIQTTDK